MRTIAHISDLHFGRHDPAVVEALLASLKRSGCDLVIVSGDLTRRARRHEFEQARSFLDRIALPMLVIPGNHDVSLHNPLSRFFWPLDRYDRYVSAKRQPLFADDEIAVLGLSTVRRLTGKNGRVSWAQMGAVRRIFGGLPGHLFKVLVTHHPLAMPNPADTLEMVGRADATLNAADAVGVHLLLSGHHHRSSSGEAPAHVARERSVLVAHAGTAVSTRTRGGEVNTYNLIHIEPRQCHLSIIVMAWAGEVGFAEVRREAYVLQEEGWRAERGDGGRPFSPAR